MSNPLTEIIEEANRQGRYFETRTLIKRSEGVLKIRESRGYLALEVWKPLPIVHLAIGVFDINTKEWQSMSTPAKVQEWLDEVEPLLGKPKFELTEAQKYQMAQLNRKDPILYSVTVSLLEQFPDAQPQQVISQALRTLAETTLKRRAAAERSAQADNMAIREMHQARKAEKATRDTKRTAHAKALIEEANQSDGPKIWITTRPVHKDDERPVSGAAGVGADITQMLGREYDVSPPVRRRTEEEIKRGYVAALGNQQPKQGPALPEEWEAKEIV